MSLNPNINIDFVLNNSYKDWNYYHLSRNPSIINLTNYSKFLHGGNYQNPSTKYNISNVPRRAYTHFSSNSNLTSDEIIKNKDKPWHYGKMSANMFNRHPYYTTNPHLAESI
jgi:hypothetical protein